MELNAEVVAFLIGEDVDVVKAQIQRMCNPDPKSRTKAEGGRRLIQMGEYEYRVVNGDKYRAIRDEETRRQQNREAQRRHRQKVPKNGTPLTGEVAALQAQARGDEEEYDRLAAATDGVSRTDGFAGEVRPVEDPESIPLGPAETEEG